MLDEIIEDCKYEARDEGLTEDSDEFNLYVLKGLNQFNTEGSWQRTKAHAESNALDIMTHGAKISRERRAATWTSRATRYEFAINGLLGEIKKFKDKVRA
jgi:hypothetical protein